MKFAICNETFVDWALERACDFSAACGYTGLEIAPFTINHDARLISSTEKAAARAAAANAGLEIIGLHWLLAKTSGLHLTSPDVATRRRTGEYLARLATLCRELGGSILVFGSPLQRNLAPDVSPADGFRYAVEVFGGLAKTLEDSQVTLAIEPLGPSDGNFLNTAAEAQTMIDALACPWIRMHLDCKAMASEPTPIPELIERHVGQMVHFHANDPNRLGPGMGDLQFDPILASLKKCGYEGWVSVEVFDYSPGPERLARESIENLKACCARIG